MLSNAVKYTPRGGQVQLRASVTASTATITVADTGIGIPGPDQAKLFTRFFRASNAVSGRIPGTGLGLAIVAGIVASHHGTIEYSTAEGTGTVVTIQFPRLPPTAADDGAPRPPMALPRSRPAWVATEGASLTSPPEYGGADWLRRTYGPTRSTGQVRYLPGGSR